MTTRRIWLMVRIPVYIENNGVGLFYATSPLIKGLLVAERTEEEAVQAVHNAVDELGTVADGEEAPVKEG